MRQHESRNSIIGCIFITPDSVRGGQFMLRLKNPCGKVDAATYKCIDELSEKYGQKDLRATTRQAFQVPETLKRKS